MHSIVLDTNVIIAALRSRRGASNRLLRLVGDGTFYMNVSVALALEYEDVMKRPALSSYSESEVDDFLNFPDCGLQSSFSGPRAAPDFA